MVKVWDVDSLIYHQVERPPGLWVSVGYHATHSLVGLSAKGFIISHHGHWSIVV